MRAAALTYNFILGLVPAIAVCMAVVSAFIDVKSVSTQIKSFLLKNLTAGTGYTASTYLDKFIGNIRFSTIGYAGFSALFLTSLLLLSNIETSMNHIWSIEKNKKLTVRLLIYILMIFLGPICLATTISATTLAKAYSPHLLSKAHFGTITVSILLFSFLYKVMPNTKVKSSWAILCGILMALASHGAKLGYAKYTAKAIFYNQIYGGLAALPLFLIWIYLNWTIFLAGTLLNYVLQNRNSLLEKSYL